MITRDRSCFFLALIALTLFQMTATSHFIRVYAKTVPVTDNCDSSSICVNHTAKARDASQYNNCNRFSSCSNLIAGSRLDSQNNNCRTSNCENTVLEQRRLFEGNSNSQISNCQSSDCGNNIANGGSNSQNIACFLCAKMISLTATRIIRLPHVNYLVVQIAD